MISVSAEAEDENFSLSDSEEANKAKTLIASRMRRRHKQKKKTSEPTRPINVSLFVDDGDESGLTDVETVEVEGGSSNEQSKSSTPAEDFTPIFDSALQPQIVQIIEDHEGKTHVKTIVQGVVAALDSSESEDDEGGPRLTLMEALTDIEDLDDSLEESDYRSDSSEMNRLIGQVELGGSVETHDQEEESARPPPQYQQRGNTAMLLCPKSAAGRKKPRKPRTKKKAAAVASTGATLLAVTTPDDPTTDVESVSGLEEEYEEPGSQASALAFTPGLKVEDVQDEGATDVEDFPFSDDEELPAGIRLAPGILVTENSETESSYDCSGRSSRLGLTDVESVHGIEDENTVPVPLGGLGLPVSMDDPVTDVEEIDNVEEDAPLMTPAIPRNGPALHAGQQHVVTIQEDEHGRVTSRKYAGSPGLLGFVDNSQQEEGGTTDVEYVGASADEDEGQSRGVTPEIEMFAGSTVRVKRHSLTADPPQLDQQDDPSDNETHAASNYSLMPPVHAVEILTDTEDMEMSDGETMGNQGQKSTGR